MRANTARARFSGPVCSGLRDSSASAGAVTPAARTVPVALHAHSQRVHRRISRLTLRPIP
jgi:hypothetical protein